MKTFFKSVVVFLLSLVLLAGSVIPVSAASVKLSKTKAVMEQDSSLKLTVSGTKSKVIWSTSDKKVAKVSKGKVTAVGEGSAVITATVGKEKYTCKVTVMNNNRSDKIENVNSEVSAYTVATADGGDFIYKESKLAIKFTLATSTYGAQLLIYDALGECIFAETFSTIKAGKETAFTWMGKDDSGSYATEGTYFVKIKCNETVNDLGTFTIYAGNEFAGGNGSESNPYKVSSIEEFKKIVRHEKACYIQTKDLDFEYENLASMFSTTAFAGTYDGNNKKISNVVLSDSIFMKTSETAVIENMVLENAILNVPTEKDWYTSVLVNYNYGKIDSCKVNASINGGAQNEKYWIGFISCKNFGTINKCEVSGEMLVTFHSGYVGSIVGENENGAKIVGCKNEAALIVVNPPLWGSLCAGSLLGNNLGVVIGCETKTLVDKADSDSKYGYTIGEIAGKDAGTIQNTYYNGN